MKGPGVGVFPFLLACTVLPHPSAAFCLPEAHEHYNPASQIPKKGTQNWQAGSLSSSNDAEAAALPVASRRRDHDDGLANALGDLFDAFVVGSVQRRENEKNQEKCATRHRTAPARDGEASFPWRL